MFLITQVISTHTLKICKQQTMKRKFGPTDPLFHSPSPKNNYDRNFLYIFVELVYAEVSSFFSLCWTHRHMLYKLASWDCPISAHLAHSDLSHSCLQLHVFQLRGWIMVYLTNPLMIDIKCVASPYTALIWRFSSSKMCKYYLQEMLLEAAFLCPWERI